MGSTHEAISAHSLVPNPKVIVGPEVDLAVLKPSGPSIIITLVGVLSWFVVQSNVSNFKLAYA
jgi:hypothetical protein